LAVADYAEGYTDDDDNPLPPPPELVIAFQVDQWGASAVYDGSLSVKLLRRMSACLNTYNAVNSYKAGSNRLADWARAHPKQADLIVSIREMRLQNG
jgi:hypothetical protein